LFSFHAIGLEENANQNSILDCPETIPGGLIDNRRLPAPAAASHPVRSSVRQESLGKIGCGIGTDTDTLNFAHGGARVTSADTSEKSSEGAWTGRDGARLHRVLVSRFFSIFHRLFTPRAIAHPVPVLVHSYFSTAKPF
jgi:hypothetical protein